MMTDDPEIHVGWFRHSRWRDSVSNVFEFYVGHPSRERMTYWNDGAVWIHEDPFIIFLPLVRRVMPEFDYYDANEFLGAQLTALGGELRSFRPRVAAAATQATLDAACGIKLDDHMNVERWQSTKTGLLRTTDEFVAIVDSAIARDLPLWINGP
jgi:hypothetical protein